ncbi:MAG: hypothetical protein GX220_01805 [Treponema sp.]|nr:hypothetical protein [Treponema sp.]
MEKYADIIDKEYPRPSIRTKMSLNNRAKIFMPFSALKGFEKAIEEKIFTNESLFFEQNSSPLFFL